MHIPVTTTAVFIKIYIFIYESPSLHITVSLFAESAEWKKPAWDYSDVNPSTKIDKQKAKDTLSFLIAGLSLFHPLYHIY